VAVNVGDVHETSLIEDINRTHIVKYAGASGDFNPLHHDEFFAKEGGGFPSVFAHGMFSMGLTGQMLTQWLGPTALKKFGVRFTRQVWPGDSLTSRAEVTDIKNEGGQRLATIKVVTMNQRGEPVVEGEALAIV
jgi:acyl dehydratase